MDLAAKTRAWRSGSPAFEESSPGVYGETAMIVAVNWQAISSNPFVTVALPIVITLIVAMVSQNKRIDDLHKRIDDLRDSLNKRLDRIDQCLEGIDRSLGSIDAKLGQHAERIAKLEGPSLVRA